MQDSQSIRSGPGSYALLFHLRQPMEQQVGKSGVFLFPAGDYVYLGSAHGTGGVQARLRHHQKVHLLPHWHLDWLRPHLTLLGGWVTDAPQNLECAWSQAVLRLPGVVAPAAGFGAADCRMGCRSHLAAFPAGVDRNNLETLLRSFLPEPEALYYWPAPWQI